MHSIFNAVCLAALEKDKVSIKHNSADDVRAVVEYIEKITLIQLLWMI